MASVSPKAGSNAVQDAYVHVAPDAAALFDYNRLENRQGEHPDGARNASSQNLGCTGRPSSSWAKAPAAISARLASPAVQRQRPSASTATRWRRAREGRGPVQST